MPEPQTLYEKTRGPNAIAVDQLVAGAEQAAAVVKRDYPSFLGPALRNLDALFALATKNAIGAGCWEKLKFAAHDLRSSSATAGYDQISAAASSLEWLLKEAVETDSRVMAVVGLHLETIHQLVHRSAPHLASPEVQKLLTELGQASNIVTRGKRP